MKEETQPFRAAIVGTGSMAAQHVVRYRQIAGCEVVAACDKDEARARAFCEQHGIPAVFGDLDAMLDSGGFDAVSNVTPDAFHHPLTMRILEAGFPVLCEKPLALSFPEANEMATAAASRGLANVVNLSYRNQGQIQRARELVMAGELGEIRHFEASYNQGWLSSNYWGTWHGKDALLWRLDSSRGSKGVLGDLGVHIIDFATYPTGLAVAKLWARLSTFDKQKVEGYTFDANDTAILTCELQNGAVGTIQTTRWATGEKNALRLDLFGTRGALKVRIAPDEPPLQVSLGSDVHEGKWVGIEPPDVPSNHERFVRWIRTGEPDGPDFARGAEIQAVMDACFESSSSGREVAVPRPSASARACGRLPMDPSRNLTRIGLIGGGHHSRLFHLPALERLAADPDAMVSLASFCDRDPQVAGEVGAKFGFARTFTEVDAFLGEGGIDAVIAVTPVAATAAIAHRIMETGLPLLMEKPPGASLDEAREVADRAREHGRVMVSMNRRFEPALRAAAGALHGRKVERVHAGMYRIDRRDPDFFRTTAIHLIDAVRALAGEVRAFEVRARLVEGVPWVVVEVAFASGAEGLLEVHPTCGAKGEVYDFFGSGFRLRATAGDTDRGECYLWEGETPVVRCESSPGEPMFIRNGTLDETRAFLRSIREDLPFVPSPADVLKSFEIGDAAQAAADAVR